MGRSKTKKYKAAKAEALIIQEWKDFWTSAKWNWRSQFFHNDNPIVLELACGRGEYTVGLSQVFPEKNYIGVDIKAERMIQGLRAWKQATLRDFPDTNIAFLRTIIQHIDEFFEENEVNEIRIIHPDPRPKPRDEKRRITSDRFLSQYKKILKPGWLIRLRTDDKALFEYSNQKFKEHWFECIAETDDLDNSPLQADHHGIDTHYGELFREQWRTIYYSVWSNSK